MPNQGVTTIEFVKIASYDTPTQAHIVKGVLESAGISVHIADANFGQANPWMTQVLGGVRLLVPQSQVAAANEVISDYNSGKFNLDGEEPHVRSFERLTIPAFSPDRAVLLSFLLTPTFAAAVQVVNSWRLGVDKQQAAQLVWLIVLSIASLAAIVVMHRINPGPLVAFRASFVMSFVTAVWYFMYGQNQSRRLLATFGRDYAKRSLSVPAFVTAAVLLALGWSLSEVA